MESPRERAISQEQAYVDRAYAALDRQRSSYANRLRAVRQQNGQESAGELSERDSFASHYEDNLIRLRNVENRLVLGRLDFEDTEVEHIGRIGLKDEEGDILLLDWRAPQAEPFYQATAANPGNVVRRRHIQTRFREVTGIEDELLDADSDVEDLNLTGEGALFAALNEARDGRMSDIVATIQAEQDTIIRSSAQGVLVVQGGPGTGKTAVALHRAAYLLYSQRERLARSGVLIVGPSPLFLRYIDQVLPSLGESDVVSTTTSGLLPGITVTATEPAEVAEIKGRRIWRTILKRAVRSLERPLTEDVTFEIESEKVTLRVDDVAEAQRKAHRTGLTHNQAWETYAKYLTHSLARQLAAAKEVDLADSPWITSDVASSRLARRHINLHWLPQAPMALLERIYARPELLSRLAHELSPAERKLLYRAPGSGMTTADIPLLDELMELLGPFEDPIARARRAQRKAEEAELHRYAATAISQMGLGGGIVDSSMLAARVTSGSGGSSLAERAGMDRTWTYGHVIVDEAQELSPMQWEMLIRRCPTRSFTIVGDVDQRPSGAPAGGWHELLGRLADHLREVELTVSYRTPGSILVTAGKILAHLGAPVRAVRAARDLPDSLSLHRVEPHELWSRVPAIVSELCDRMDQEYGSGGGTLAVIVPESEHAAAAAALQESEELSAWSIDPTGDDIVSRIQVISSVQSKGLEFDVVVLIEPSDVVREGSGNLYVAMTRPTRHLAVVHSTELPGGPAIWADLAENAPIRKG